MSLVFDEVLADDFMSFQPGKKPTYSLIEEALISIGGGGLTGHDFKKVALEQAGWKYGKLISYGAHPDTAASAFNKVRDVLSESQDKEEILGKLH